MIHALSFDFEDWYQGLEIPMSKWSGFERRIAPVTDRLLEILDEAGVRATFFVLGRLAEEHPALVRMIGDAGHEVGTHGYSHTLVYQQSPSEFEAEIERAIAVVGDLTGQKAVGHRAPFFSITKDSLWALEILARHGILYDSSIFPVTNYRYGISDAERGRHTLAAGTHEIVEVPVSVLRVAGLNLPVGGGAYFRIYPYELTRQALRAVERDGRPIVFYLHPWELDPGHPRIPLPRRIALTHYFNLGATEKRLRQLLTDFRFAPMREVFSL